MPDPRDAQLGDTVSWRGTTGDRLIGVLVGRSRAGAPIVRRWVASRRQFGKPQTVATVERAAMDEWINDLA
jgi:hypothetical protein